ncbi:ATP-binding protein [Symbiobacterium terraclitae]|uniref:ATP-binding protein n=1 Tax=Symbiobacterium terraclitae TaxID=557451 RepID=UPI0035B517FF
MKWLTAIKLVNWHYFVNETIRLHGSTLLTGDNGSGKSTILDALQFALIADQRRVRFNISAHDETNRDLKGYLRCRTGRDDPDGGDGEGYLRGGDFTSYVALEFHDTARDDHFQLGFVVDVFAGEPDTPQFFRINGPLDESLFLEGDRPLSAAAFKASLRARRAGEVFPSASAYRTALKAQLGHLDDRFFTLLVKALAFHPITDIRRFVYDYVLDEREVKIDAMLENFRQYRHYDHLAAQTKEKIARLEQIAARFKEKSDLEATATIQQYVILRAQREQVQEELDRLRRQEAHERQILSAARAEKEKAAAALERLEAELRELYDARARDDAYQALQAIDRALADLSREAADLQREGQALARDARAVAACLEKALRLAETQSAALALEDEAPLAALADSARRLDPLIRGDLTAPPADLSRLEPALDALRSQISLREYRLRDQQRALQAEKRELEEALSALRQKRRQYPAAVEALRAAISEELDGLEARVLCELLEIPDERWQNAVEGYLNTQRFDLFVPPEAFDAALAVYERTKVERKIQSVGLVNSEALLRSGPTRLPGSLAEEVETADPAARAYVDRLLGRVMKCENEQELKRHAVAITPTCMTYRNHTARQIEFHVYAVPYIGSRAIARQIELKQQRLGEVLQQLEQVDRDLKVCAEFHRLLDSRMAASFPERWQRVTRLPALREAIAAKEEERRQIDVGALNALQRQIASKEESRALLRDKEKKAIQDETAARERLQRVSDDLRQAEARWRERHEELERFVAVHPAAAEQGAARYMEATRNRANAAIVQNYTYNRQGLLTQAERLGQELYRLRLEYNNRYQFGGAPDAADNAAYDRELRKLAESELVLYEEKIAEARAAAEQEFKEHFVFRLQENIRLARQEFDNLNRVLREIPFGQDRYQFTCTPDHTHRAFYDMIMDDFAVEGPGLFSLYFQEKYGDTLNELFRLILDVPEEKQLENIRRYTDYRTYLEYDIKIHHENGETSSFSKVARAKSGGETQTPYYVAIVASFLQLYRPRQNPHTVRLMLFDEAFNRMDPDRAEQTLEFIRRLGLQVLAAAPTDKCEIITPHVETTLLVMRDGHRAWIEDYHQVLAASGEEGGDGR